MSPPDGLFYAGPASNALGLVESPAQLLNVIEVAREDDSLAGVRIAVLAPGAGATRTQLRAMVALAREAGHPVSWHEPQARRRGCGAHGPRAGR